MGLLDPTQPHILGYVQNLPSLTQWRKVGGQQTLSLSRMETETSFHIMHARGCAAWQLRSGFPSYVGCVGTTNIGLSYHERRSVQLPHMRAEKSKDKLRRRPCAKYGSLFWMPYGLADVTNDTDLLLASNSRGKLEAIVDVAMQDVGLQRPWCSEPCIDLCRWRDKSARMTLHKHWIIAAAQFYVRINRACMLLQAFSSYKLLVM